MNPIETRSALFTPMPTAMRTVGPMTHEERNLTPDQLALRHKAFSEVAELLAYACYEIDRMTPEAVAKGAYVPGGPSELEIADLVRKEREEARARQNPT